MNLTGLSTRHKLKRSLSLVLPTISLLLLFPLEGCNASLTRSKDVPQWLRVVWREGQERVERVAGTDAYSVHPEQFEFVEKANPFYCDKVYAVGCYHSGQRSITYWSQQPKVIRHEAGHAILHVLGSDNWRCYEHTC